MSKNIIYTVLIMLLVMLSGCNSERFDKIDTHQVFVASLNIQEPSIQFFNEKGQQLANWSFKKAYTGAVLIEQDMLLLYGNQLDKADLYKLSTGEKIEEFDTGIGTTNGIYVDSQKKIYLTNSKTNAITSYDIHGKQLQTQKLGNYPMSMAASDAKLYVVNYKDTKLSVLNIKDLSVEDEWQIEKSSHGLVILPDQHTLWLGGHGEGSHPNQTVDIYDLTTGKQIKQINTPLMPVGFYQTEDAVFIVSHGGNEIFAVSRAGNIQWHKEVAANPFAVTVLRNKIIVAGYDDQKLYFMDKQKVIKKVSVGKGPFQLLVRE